MPESLMQLLARINPEYFYGLLEKLQDPAYAVPQLGILVFSISAMTMLSSKYERVRNLAYFIGLCSQPFWLYAAVQSSQIGMLITSSIYTIMWIRGIFNISIPYLRSRREPEERA